MKKIAVVLVISAIIVLGLSGIFIRQKDLKEVKVGGKGEQ